MDDLPDYTYIPLPTKDHIRLLELLPAGEDDNGILRCRLIPSLLADVRDTYTAISYAWGDTALAVHKPIICDGCSILITPTLHSALRRLRDASSFRLLWADALCIDQSQNEERSQQVELMSQIFAEAQSVLVDLGEIEPRDEYLLEAFHEVEVVSQEEWSAATAKFNYTSILNPDGSLAVGARPTWLQSTANAVHSTLSTAIFGSPKPPRWEELFDEPNVWTGLKHFFERPWFGRLWVMQEFALGKRVNILVGESIKSEYFMSHTLPRFRTHSMIFLAGSQVSKEELVSHTSLRHMNLLQHLLEMRHVFKNKMSPRSSLPDMFTRAHLASCADSRDKVYGILGLVDGQSGAEIQVDYTESAERLAFRVTTLFMRQGKGVYALYNASGCEGTGASWTLGLHYREYTDQLAVMVPPNVTAQDTPYLACGSTQATFLWAEQDQTLLTKGYILDTVSHLTGPLVNSVDPGETRHARLQWQLETFVWIQKHKFNIPFDPPKIKGLPSYRKHNLIRQLAINHQTALNEANEDFEFACWTAAIADLVFPPPHGPRRGASDPRLRSYIQAFRAWLEQFYTEAAEQRQEVGEAHGMQLLERAGPYLGSLQITFNRRLGITKERLVCLLPKPAQIGDSIAILFGCPIPFVLRPRGKEWRIVGCCYVHGMMDGQVLQVKDLDVTDIVLC